VHRDSEETRARSRRTLAVLCGLRRGEIAALRWGSVDLDKAQLAVIQSAERTRAGVRYKPPKNDRVRTVALSSLVVAILRQHRLDQAERMLRLGVRLEDAAFVVAQADGSPYDPDSISKEWRLQVLSQVYRASASTICGTRTRVS
jgi:integrase